MKKGWEVKKLGEVCSLVRGPFGGSLKKNCFINNGYAIYEQQHAIYGNFSFRYFIDENKFQEMKRFEVFPNDILMSCSGTMGKMSIVPMHSPKGIINQALLKLTTNKFLLNTFLKYWMESELFQDEISKHSKGAAIQNVASIKILKDISIYLPSLSEQQRIVKILDTTFAKIDTIKQNAERNLQNVKELFKNISNSIFDELSQEERVKKLGEVCDFVRGPFGGSLKKNCFKNKGYPVYEQQHAIYNKFVFRYYIDEDKFQEMKRFEVFPNDILMSCSGTLGKISIVPKNAPQGIINQALLKLTVKKGLLNTYLKAWMESFSFQESLNNYSKGAAIQNVASVKILKDISIHLPSIDKQHQIVTKLNALSIKSKELENNYRQTITDCDEMKKSILAKAFNGEL